MLAADLEYITKQVNTTLLEGFHAKKISYLPKNAFFRMKKMVAGTQIAAQIITTNDTFNSLPHSE